MIRGHEADADLMLSLKNLLIPKVVEMGMNAPKMLNDPIGFFSSSGVHFDNIVTMSPSQDYRIDRVK